jgi:hypothetical protein
VAKPPGPQGATPEGTADGAKVESAIEAGEVQSKVVPPIVPTVPIGILAFLIWELMSSPGPLIKVVTRLFSSLCRVYRS